MHIEPMRRARTEELGHARPDHEQKMSSSLGARPVYNLQTADAVTTVTRIETVVQATEPRVRTGAVRGNPGELPAGVLENQRRRSNWAAQLEPTKEGGHAALDGLPSTGRGG
jgi:hypothetical protein